MKNEELTSFNSPPAEGCPKTLFSDWVVAFAVNS